MKANCESSRGEKQAARRIRWREGLIGVAAYVLRSHDKLSAPTSWSLGSPILLYHRILDRSDPIRDPFAVYRDDFQRQMDWLSQRFTLISATELAMRLRRDRSVRGLASVTLDDGYPCTFSHALPVLQSYAVPATLFVDTDRLGRSPSALTASQLRALAQGGIDIQSHGAGHRDLPSLGDEELRSELIRSRDVISKITGTAVTGIAYPFGRYDDRVARAARQTGYNYACTCRQHRTNHVSAAAFHLNRVEINQRDGACRFEQKVRGRFAAVYATWYRLNPTTRAWLNDE